MAPIEADLSHATLFATASFGGFAIGSLALIAVICYDVLYKAYIALPPSQDTRNRKSNREKHVRIHAFLAVAGLASSCYHILHYTSLSYRVWAHEVGHAVPVLRTLGWDLGSQYHIGRWWADTDLLQDLWEIIVDRSRRYWWAEQHLLGSAAWAAFVGLEGRRRSIRHLWAFLLLGQFLSLSFSMNLFFLAVILHPISVPSTLENPSARSAESSQIRIRLLPDFVNETLTYLRTHLPPFPTHPHAYPWTPSPYAYLPTILTLQGAVYLLPFTTHTPHFMTAVIIIHVASYRLAYMDRLTAVAYGSTKHPSRKYTSVYRAASFVCLLLHAKSTITALLDNDPGAYPSNHRHSQYLAALRLPHERERSGLMRSSLSFTRVLTSLNDHPAVALIGYDVLLAILSLCIWAALRGVHVEKVLYSAGIVHIKPLSAADEADVDSIKQQSTAVVASGAKPRRRNKKSIDNTTMSSPLTSDIDTPTPAAPLSKETAADDVASKSDRAFRSPAPISQVLRGDEEEDENLEVGAVSGALGVIGGLGMLANGVLGAESEG